MTQTRRQLLAGLAAMSATAAMARSAAQRELLLSNWPPLGLPRGAFGIWPFDLLSGGKVPNLVDAGSPLVTGGSLAAGELTGNGTITLPSSRVLPGFTVSCLVKVTAINTYNMILYDLTNGYSNFSYHTVSAFTGNGGGPVKTQSLNNFIVGVSPNLQTQYGGFTNLVGKGYHVLTLSRNIAGDEALWIDDVKLYQNKGSGLGSIVLGPSLKFGISPEPVQSGHKYAGFLGFWNRGLTDAEIRKVVETQRTYGARSGIALSDSTDRILIAEGDSNHGMFDHNCWIWQFAANDSPENFGGSYGISGNVIANLASRAAFVDSIIPPNPGGRKFIMTVGIGTNDLTAYNSTTVSTVFIPAVRAYMMARKAAGWTLALFTVPYRGDISGATLTNFETVRAIYNADVVANPTLYGLTSGSQVIDIGSAPGIGSGGQDLSKYISPYIHFSATGGAQVEALARPIVNAL